MGASSAVISRNMFAELKRYVQTVLQAGVPLMDADYNDQIESGYTQLRRMISDAVGDGARGDAFKIVENVLDPLNNFLISGSVIEDEGPEGLFVKGHRANLAAAETFKLGLETSPVSSAIAGTQLVDSAGSYVPGSLIGRTLVPNLALFANQFTIIANTATVITVAADITSVAQAGDNYRVLMTTPPAGPNRLDLVLLDVYLDEIDSTEDADLKHTIDSIQLESMRRRKLVQRVMVTEGITLPVTLPSGYVDSDGNRHVQVPLALIDRPGLIAGITNPMITDLRRKIFRLDEIDDRYVNVDGDTMTGPLVMQANISMDPGFKVLGTCVIDGTALCDEIIRQKHFDRTEHLLGDGDSIPTAAQVQDPLDPDHFEVHDNRYYTKTEIDGIVGSNLLANSTFTCGFDCWDNASPSVLSGMPQSETPDIIAVPGICGSACGTACGCSTMQVSVPVGNRVCFVCVLRQDVCGGIKCGGEFLLVETVCVTRGNEALIPFITLDLYSSCQFVGTKKVQMYQPPEGKFGLELEDGFQRLEERVSLPTCIDQVIMTLCFEVIPQEKPDPPEGEMDISSIRSCEVGPDPFEWVLCSTQFRRVGGGFIVDGLDGCKPNKIPMIEECFPDGRVRITPAHNQVATIIEVLEGPDGCGSGQLPP